MERDNGLIGYCTSVNSSYWDLSSVSLGVSDQNIFPAELKLLSTGTGQPWSFEPHEKLGGVQLLTVQRILFVFGQSGSWTWQSAVPANILSQNGPPVNIAYHTENADTAAFR